MDSCNRLPGQHVIHQHIVIYFIISGAKNYILTTTLSEDLETIIKIHNLTQTTYTITDLEPGRQYTVQVETVSTSGDYSTNFKRVNFQTSKS